MPVLRPLAQRAQVPTSHDALNQEQGREEGPPRLQCCRAGERANGQLDFVSTPVNDEGFFTADRMPRQCSIGEPDPVRLIDDCHDFHWLDDRRTPQAGGDTDPVARGHRPGRCHLEAAGCLHSPAKHLRGRAFPRRIPASDDSRYFRPAVSAVTVRPVGKSRARHVSCLSSPAGFRLVGRCESLGYPGSGSLRTIASVGGVRRFPVQDRPTLLGTVIRC